MDSNIEMAIRKVLREELAPLRYGDDLLLSTEEAAEFLGVKTGTLATYRSQGEGPAYVKVKENNGKVLYRLGSLRSYCKNREVNTKHSYIQE